MHTSARLTSDQQALNAHDVAVYEECLAYARSHARGAAEGFFGPGSMMWLLHRESVSLYPGLLRSVVMQVAHPTLNTAAFTGDTKLVRNVRARAAGTFRAMYEVVFGDLDSAIKAGLMTHRIHQSVWGMRTAPDGSAQQFRANDPELLLWVFATILNSEVVGFTEINRPLTPDEEARLWKEAKVLAAVIGIPQEYLPATWADFNAYIERMVKGDTLRVDESLRAGCEALTWRFVPVPVPPWLLRTAVVGMIPEGWRERAGFPWGPSERYSHAVVKSALRTSSRWLPGAVRFPPHYHRALQRLNLRAEPSLRLA